MANGDDTFICCSGRWSSLCTCDRDRSPLSFLQGSWKSPMPPTLCKSSAQRRMRLQILSGVLQSRTACSQLQRLASEVIYLWYWSRGCDQGIRGCQAVSVAPAQKSNFSSFSFHHTWASSCDVKMRDIQRDMKVLVRTEGCRSPVEKVQ